MRLWRGPVVVFKIKEVLSLTWVVNMIVLQWRIFCLLAFINSIHELIINAFDALVTRLNAYSLTDKWRFLKPTNFNVLMLVWLMLNWSQLWIVITWVSWLDDWTDVVRWINGLSTKFWHWWLIFWSFIVIWSFSGPLLSFFHLFLPYKSVR